MTFPIPDAWVLLLEDKKHRKARLLTEELKWIKEACQARQKLYDEMDELLARRLKCGDEPLGLSTTYGTISGFFSQRVQRYGDGSSKVNRDRA